MRAKLGMEARRRGSAWPRRAVIGVALAALAGCDESGVSERWVDKGVETIPEEGAVRDRASSGAPTDDGAPTWTLPPGWTRVETDRPMRLATFEAPANGSTVEVAATRFPGRVGGERANVNRWRGQIGLPTLDGAGADGALERMREAGCEIYLARLESGERALLAVGVYDPRADRTTFLKAETTPADADGMTGDFAALARTIARESAEGNGP